MYIMAPPASSNMATLIKIMVGVPTPETGVPEVVAGIIILGTSVGIIVGSGEILGVADGVPTNAGPSPAETTKVRVKVCNFPLAFFQERVLLWLPESRLFVVIQFL